MLHSWVSGHKKVTARIDNVSCKHHPVAKNVYECLKLFSLWRQLAFVAKILTQFGKSAHKNNNSCLSGFSYLVLQMSLKMLNSTDTKGGGQKIPPKNVHMFPNNKYYLKAIDKLQNL